MDSTNTSGISGPAPRAADTGGVAREMLVVVNKLDAAVTVVDPGTRAVIAHIPLPPNPHELLLAPDRRTAYVSIYGDGVYGNNVHYGRRVAVVDLMARAVVGEIDLGAAHAAPHGLAWDAAGLLWVCCDRSMTVAVVDPARRSVVATIPLGATPTPHWIAVTPDGRTAYTSNKATPYLSVIDTAARRAVATITVPSGTEGLALSPDGTRLYVTDHMGSGLPRAVAKTPTLYAIDTATNAVVQAEPLRDIPALPVAEDHETRVRATPDGRHVLVSAYKWNLVAILDATDLAAQRLMPVGPGPMGLAFPPGEGETRYAYVANHDGGTIAVLDLAAATIVDTFAAGHAPLTGPETVDFFPVGT